MAIHDERTELLLHMYDQMWRNIDRHIIVVWQSVVVVLGAVVAPLLAKVEHVDLDLTISALMIICGWGVAVTIDGSYWYNRNLLIIANIERQFLERKDIHNIHYYFTSHRKPSMIEHHMIQAVLSAMVAGLFLTYHFCVRVLPTFSPSNRFDFLRALPYMLVAVIAYLMWLFNTHTKKNYEKLRRLSPGKTLTEGESPKVTV